MTVLGDVRLLAWLRIRHARTALARLAHFAGTDPLVDRGVGERSYQLYIAAITAVAFALLWAALLDSAQEVFAGLGAEASAALLSAALIVPAALFAAQALKALRTSPVRLSHPDIALVAASSLGSRAIVGVGACASLLGVGVASAFAGYLLGTCLQAGMGTFADPLAVAFSASLLAMAAVGGSWLVGVVRLGVGRKRPPRRAAAVLALAGAGAAVLAAAAAGGVLAVAATPAGVAAAVASGALPAAAAALVAVEAALLALASPRIDWGRVVRENALFADLQPFGSLSPLDPTAIRDYRRRCRLAHRGPRFRVPLGQGRAALASRAALTLLRQYEGWPDLLAQGALAACGACVLLGAGGPIALLFWLTALLTMPQGSREVTRAFRDDVRIGLVRNRLPFGTLELLVVDSLPAFALTAVLAAAAAVVAVLAAPMLLPAGAAAGAVGGAGAALAALLAVLVDAALVLACGLDAVRLYPRGPRLCYEYGVLAVVGVGGALSTLASPLPLVAGMAVACAVIATLVRRGTECAR